MRCMSGARRCFGGLHDVGGAVRGRFFVGLGGVAGGGRARALRSNSSRALFTFCVAAFASSAVSAPRTLSGCSASDRSLHVVWISLGLAPGSTSRTSSGLPAAEARMTLL